MKKYIDMVEKALHYIYEAATYAEIVKEEIEKKLDEELWDEEIWDEMEYWEDLYDKIIEVTNEIEDKYNI